MNEQPVSPFDAPVYGSQNLIVRPPVDLLGRDADLSSIHLSLKAGTAVLLHGPAGVGKSALAAHLAAGYAELPGGVLWFELQGDPLPVLQARVARAYGITWEALGTDPTARAGAVQAILNEQRPLIVLDGSVDMESAREFVRTSAAGIPLLMTSPALVAGPWTPHHVQPLAREASEALLFQLTSLTQAHADASPDLFRRLYEATAGYPMALVLAAQALAVGQVQPDDLLKQIPRLPPGDANRALGVMTAAYRVQPAALQGLVLLLGTALAGSASSRLFSQVGGAPVPVIEQTMRQLAGRGFATERARHGIVVFAAHDMVQTFAQTLLKGRKKLVEMQQRHVKGVVALTRELVAAPSDEALAYLTLEMPNILAAARYAAEHNDRATVQTLRDLLAPTEANTFVPARDRWAEYQWLERILDPDTQPVPTAESQETAPTPEPAVTPSQAATRPEPDALPATPETPPSLPDENVQPGDTAGATAHEQMAGESLLTASPSTLDDTLVTTQAQLQADIEALSEPPEAASDAAAAPPPETVPAAPDLPEPLAEPTVAPTQDLLELAEQASEASDPSAAIASYSEALETYQADGNIEDELAALEALAGLSLQADNYEDALAYVDRGMALAEQVDNPLREAHLLIVLGDLQASLARWDGAEIAYREALEALRPAEAWLEMAHTLDKLSDVYVAQRRLPEAAGTLEQANIIFERENQTALLCENREQLGDICADMMQWNKSIQNYSQALECVKGRDDDDATYQLLDKMGDVLEASGARDGALNFYRQALALAFKLDDPARQGHAMLAMARLQIDDTILLSRVVHLLEGAAERLPDNTEVQRLLKRARTRQERLLANGVTLMLPEDDLTAYSQTTAEKPAP